MIINLLSICYVPDILLGLGDTVGIQDKQDPYWG